MLDLDSVIALSAIALSTVTAVATTITIRGKARVERVDTIEQQLVKVQERLDRCEEGREELRKQLLSLMAEHLKLRNRK